MKKATKIIFTLGFSVIAAFIFVSCAGALPYDRYDSEGYTVSIKYDANGGMFTTNVEVMVDTYKLSDLPDDGNGNKLVALVAPNDPIRGTGNAHTASNAGYFLAGWYQERIPVVNDKGEALDAGGNVASESGNPPAYKYSGRWDFENGRLTIDPSKDHSSKEPITLYAAWIPEFKFEFYSMQTGESLGEYLFDPNYISDIPMPQWNKETGKLDLYKFPHIIERTFEGAYLDADGIYRIDGDKIAHTGTYDPENATAKDPVMKLYLNYIEGEWYHIYTAQQFADNIISYGRYEILADLDFENVIWPTSLLHGNFRGIINGNGHIFKNISVTQTDTRKQNTGLFAYLGSEADINDLTIENATLKIENGTLQQDAAFGLFSGTLDDGAKLSNITIKSSRLLIKGTANIPDSAEIGLLCGVGSTFDIDLSDISCELVGDNVNNITVKVNGNEVIIEKQK